MNFLDAAIAWVDGSDHRAPLFRVPPLPPEKSGDNPPNPDPGSAPRASNRVETALQGEVAPLFGGVDPVTPPPTPLPAVPPGDAARKPKQGAGPGFGTGNDGNRLEPLAIAKSRNTRDTSIIAYDKVRVSGQLNRQQAALLTSMAAVDRTFTRSELAQLLGWRINVVCARVNELLQEPFNRLQEVGRRRCAVTGETAHELKLVEVL